MKAKAPSSGQPESNLPSSEIPGEIASLARISEPAETLLVVDDDEAVRQLETEILRQEGYNVLQAEGAAEALRVAASTATIHLLVTDFAMPEVDGLELARRFRVAHPQTPVLVVSGSLPLPRNGFEDLGRVELLAKPFAFNELLRKVRALLQAAVSTPTSKPWCCD